MSHSHSSRPLSRRGFLLGAATGTAAGLALGVPATLLALRYGQDLFRQLGIGGQAFTGQPREVANPSFAMPGPYPGRVVEVRHSGSVTPTNEIVATCVDDMIDTGMARLVGNDDPRDIKASWAKFFTPGEVIGIKVNPVGRKPKPGEPGRVRNAVGSISSPPVLLKIVRCLKELGIKPKDIVIFERYANEFADAGYLALMNERELQGVRWAASAIGYSNDQVDISGFDVGNERHRFSPELCKGVVGYDPDVFTVMGFCNPQHSHRDERRYRSHLSGIITRMVDKVITIPVLKDHRSAGVTLALKNMSHGMNSNVARSHLSGVVHGLPDGPQLINGPNQCNTFIPQAVAHDVLRRKATLHIMDGLIGVYEGGPGCWNKSWGTWAYKGLFFGTDPVAMDHVGWNILDTKRAEEGWPSVAHIGSVYETPGRKIQRGLSSLAGSTPFDTASLMTSGRFLQDAMASEALHLRQPDHVILAGQLNLGVFDRRAIYHQSIDLG